MDSDSEFALVETPELPPRRVQNILAEETAGRGGYHQYGKTKRKRCDTWHGDENKNDNQLDPDIEQGLNTKRKFARKNAWGYCSYADLITMALQRAPSKQMTLAEIYDWIVANIPFFKDKGDANSSVGWKNSIRHNLSLHDKFSRVTPTNATKNIGAYWTLVPENEQKDGTVSQTLEQSEKSPKPSEQMPSPRSPPTNIRKRSSTMPSSLNRPQRPKYKRNAHNDGDSGILSREGSCASLATNNVADDLARIKLENSPCHQPQHEERLSRIQDENMQTINRYNREAKINPDNSVLVEIKLTGEQFELVKSGKFVVSLCAADSISEIGDPRLQLNNWNAKNPTPQNRPPPQQQQQRRTAPPTYDSLKKFPSETAHSIPIQRKNAQNNHPFSPLSSESSGLGQSYDSPPEHFNNQTVLVQSQQQRNQPTPMLTNNNELDYDENQFKVDQPSTMAQRTISTENSMTTGTDFSLEPNTDGIFDDLYNEFNLYELNDICDNML